MISDGTLYLASLCKEAHFFFPTTKDSTSGYMELVGFDTSSKAKNHCFRLMRISIPLMEILNHNNFEEKMLEFEVFDLFFLYTVILTPWI